jgi:hypothetical protein
LLFLAKYFFDIFLYLRIIDYFRLKIDDLRNAFDCKIISSERRSDTRRKRLRCASDSHKSSIVNLQSSIFLFLPTPTVGALFHLQPAA